MMEWGGSNVSCPQFRHLKSGFCRYMFPISSLYDGLMIKLSNSSILTHFFLCNIQTTMYFCGRKNIQ